ncbi:peroxisome proliferator-activated receptor gamma coactivator-related protein 1 [Rhinoderma darwinii]|uniref:peroxisome proliferator-activated receptor gamma coactivator-related protein 1 n=1 Tax=Rhinoderma darwinii TaxID=43563 RepID=UPI003F662C0D
MAARWGAGEETLTIGGMELFTAGGPLQCHDLEEDETCDGLSDFTLSSLDAGGILETFQGYIDNSIISIIDDPGSQGEHKGHFDENELSLLTALTEILDNADDENMSPFDTIPDTDFLVSTKDRDGSAKFLSLCRTPPEREMFPLGDQRRTNPIKIDGRYSGPNWELFPDTICSTPKRPNRHTSVRGCLPRRAEAEETLQRSDGEDEEAPSPVEMTDKNSSLLAFVDAGADINDLDHEKILKQGTPCIINTENFALNDLVKYMHPYCLPAITTCLESEDDENLNHEVFLEIVSDQGECIKVPVVVEPPEDVFCSESSDGMEEMDVETGNLINHLSSSEQRVRELEMNNEEQTDCIEKSHEVQEPMEKNYETITTVPKIQDLSPQPPDVVVKSSDDDDDTCNSEEIVPDCKKNSEPDITVSIIAKEKLPLKGKRSSKDKPPAKSKAKSKMKSAAEVRSPEVPITVQTITQPPASRPSNPSLQESDLLTKTLDQVKKDSQMELRSAKIGRTKARICASFDSSNPEKKMPDRKIKPVSKESQPAKSTLVVAEDLEQNPKLEKPKSEETPDPSVKVEGLQSGKDLLVAAESSSMEESGPSKVEDVQDGDSLQPTKEAKPKSVSLSEYRKRLQHRKPNPDRDQENLSCSKWPTVPEPPTELAELPCLIAPTQPSKPSEGRPCPPNKTSSVPGQDVPVNPASAATTLQVKQCNDKPCPSVVGVAPPPMITPQPNLPPPFYPPAWPTVPPHPSFYSGMPPLPPVHHYSNGMPPILPVQPPPVMSWPPFPPPPIAGPPVHPTGWVSGPPALYWSNAQVAQGMPECRSLHKSSEKSVPFSASNLHALSDQRMMPESVVPPIERRTQSAALHIVQTSRMPVLKAETSGGPKEPKPASIKSSTSDGPHVGPALKSDATSLSIIAAAKSQTAPPPDSQKANVPIPDVKSANQVVIKIMEILKKAQKLGFQIKPSSDSAVVNTQLGIQGSPSVSAVKLAQPKQMALADVQVQEVAPPVIDKSSAQQTPLPVAKVEMMPTAPSVTAHEVAKDKLASACIVPNQEAKEPVVLPPVEMLCTSEKSFQTTAESDQKKPERSLNWESGIEASDLTSLLEQFEKSEAKEEERPPQSPDKLAVGNSGSGRSLEKKILLPPELVNTAGLTPPATPPHQLWKSVAAGPLTTKSLRGQGKTCSPLKTTKLIDPKPLLQSRLKKRHLGCAPSVASPPIHVASGDHDYCILSSQRTESRATTTSPSHAPPSQCEEGSRWNVKHHQNITIKPIVQFNKPPQNKACSKQPAPSAPSVVTNQSTTCGPVKPVAPCDGIQKASSDPLDHRTNMAESAVESPPPGSVLMSPDSSPCRSENGESRTDLKKGSASGSRRSLRCYRKYKGSPSPQKSWRGRSSGSRSDSRSSFSSSSSRSRSGSPASKRRRTSRCRSRSRHRSRSSSRSSYGSSSSSRSCSSRSCSPSSSRSRSRSNSPYRERYRSRRCESRESFSRRKMYHKERAIEERRVVYIGNINNRMTRSELRRRFSVFGDIEECTIHFREEGDNYGFVTYRCTREAFAAIENGHQVRLPDELPFDLCFGGRRQFCKSNYVDLDSNCKEYDPSSVRNKFEALDFDTLLKQAQKSHRR